MALIRLSGTGCHAILRRCLKPRADQLGPLRELRLERLVDPASGELIDEAMVVFFAGPRSYTGEDSAEIQAHGSPYVVQRILTLLYREGCRPAAPGEFTRRAFLNGKLDLTAAEGIRELIEAQTHQQWVAARQLASGRLREAIDQLREDLVGAMAFLEAQIDFPDEGDTAHLHLEMVRSRVRQTQAQLQRLATTYDNGRVASQGLMVALYGAPNAGKSTLMNTLLGRERAIVTPIAGTTRDYLEERCVLQGRLIRLVDLAGVREGEAGIDPVEQIGMAAARRLGKQADIVLFLASADDGDAAERVGAWLAELQPQSHLKLRTKSDLLPQAPPAGAGDSAWLALSCHSGQGLDELQRRLVAKVDSCVTGLNQEQAFVTSARHLDAIRRSLAAMGQFFAADQAGAYEELLAFELQEAVAALSSIIGDVGHEDVLDRVFREFCVGK